MGNIEQKRLLSIQFLVFFYAFYRKTSYDAAKITSRRSISYVPM